MPITYRTINVPDKDTQLIQDNTRQAVSQLSASPFQNGRLIGPTNLTSGQDNLVAHGLGRTPQICVLARVDGAATISQPNSNELGGAWANDKYVNVHCSVSCQAYLWIS